MTLKHLARLATLLLVVLSFGSGAAAAWASPITAGTYSLTNAYVNGSSITGAVTISSAGVVTSTNLVFNNAAFANAGKLPTFNQVSSTGTYNGLSQNYLVSSDNSGQIALYFNLNANANGSFDLCLGSAQCGTSAGTVAPSTLQIYGFYDSSTSTSNPGMSATNLSSGYLVASGGTVASTVTPEPSSLMLLGTGIFGLAGGLRVRLRR